MHSFCNIIPIVFIVLHLLSLCLLSTSHPITTPAAVNRRLLHQPLFPVDHALPPAPFPAPGAQPPLEPKYPFSSLSPPTTPQTQAPFFPFYTSPAPPPPPPSAAMVTFPANISSLIVPRSTSSSGKPISHKLVVVIISVSFISAAVILSIVGFLFLHHNRRRYQRHEPPTAKTDNVRLFPPNATPSDRTPTTKKVPHRPPPLPPQLSRHTASTSSSEFLYLGTLVSSREVNGISHSPKNSLPPYQSLGSPELLPLPPLPRHQFHEGHSEPKLGSDDEDEYFSPRGSTGERQNNPEEKNEAENGRISTSNSYHYSQNHSLVSSPSIELHLSPKSSMRSVSPDSIANFPAPPLYVPIPAQGQLGFQSSPPSSGDTRNSPSRVSDSSGMYMESPGEILSLSARFGAGVGVIAPPPPSAPPPPPPRFWETPVMGAGPPELVAPSRPVLGEDGESMESVMKPKLKALHWDKVRASSDRAMVWDQLKSSSFQLNEVMIQKLFTANALNSNPNAKDKVWRPMMPTANQENQVLDLKKSQNIAILLRALNVTEEEVCDALLEGNADMLGTELLESLLKMAPTKEEETRLREFKDESPFKLGPAEKFLKAVLCVPNAFKRVDAMLYIANFDSEVEYLNRSFETLEESCRELRNSRMFMKLLEAVLKTGNRMNVGTNRGDAHAFKLDTLLKLVDVKGTDGRTTLLHFVVQEIIKAEGSHLAGATSNQTAETDHQLALQNEVEFKKLGLQVVSGLSGELSNVKKAAAMDSDALNHDVAKLASGIDKIVEVLKLSKEELALSVTDASKGFSEYLEGFLKKAEEDIVALQTQEGVALSMVKELTEYFHGNSAKEEAHPFRTFMVVKDFLFTLDQVCKDVGKMNERTMMSSGRQSQTMLNHPSLPQVFPELSGGLYNGSDDDERLTFSS